MAHVLNVKTKEKTPFYIIYKKKLGDNTHELNLI